MQAFALEHSDPYGIWSSSRYLAAMYLALYDYVSAKKYILQSIKVHNETDDPTVKRQSLCRSYCDLSDTYPVGSDSMRICIYKAIDERVLKVDTLRCNFYMAVLAAIDKDEESYRKYRDLCLHDEMLRTVSKTATTMFHLIDDIMDGSINDKEFEEIGELSTMREMKFVVNITEIYGHEHTAFILEKHLMELVEQHFSKSNQMNMAELDARMGNKILSANLEQKSKQLERTSLTLSIVVVIVLLGLLAFAYSQVISLRRRRLRDQKMINELTEANRKAEIANAAKTRFVQNMSHEVRTPLEPFTFRTDPQRVQQILINLLTNACKHTPQGEIVLASSTTARKGFVTFSVTDTGPGIPADKAEAIFDRFTKLNGFVQGTGLGLSICREIATLMGSNVYLDTSYTKGGARFVLEIPIVPPEHQNG